MSLSQVKKVGDRTVYKYETRVRQHIDYGGMSEDVWEVYDETMPEIVTGDGNTIEEAAFNFWLQSSDYHANIRRFHDENSSDGDSINVDGGL